MPIHASPPSVDFITVPRLPAANTYTPSIVETARKVEAIAGLFGDTSVQEANDKDLEDRSTRPDEPTTNAFPFDPTVTAYRSLFATRLGNTQDDHDANEGPLEHKILDFPTAIEKVESE